MYLKADAFSFVPGLGAGLKFSPTAVLVIRYRVFVGGRTARTMFFSGISIKYNILWEYMISL